MGRAFLLMLFVALMCGEIQGYCEPPWKESIALETCIHRPAGLVVKSWNEARAYCKGMSSDSDLVKIGSQAKQNFVKVVIVIVVVAVVVVVVAAVVVVIEVAVVVVVVKIVVVVEVVVIVVVVVVELVVVVVVAIAVVVVVVVVVVVRRRRRRRCSSKRRRCGRSKSGSVNSKDSSNIRGSCDRSSSSISDSSSSNSSGIAVTVSVG
ncbi:LOW QUALITY PROTEIN: hypothetical protein ElyMa_005692900 [Elysia marginata]|uniref:C-type lectin domain-containing protein n=1 Tax=Elysia marginata TaxID=1093978 RepID=A0AAV4FHY7_9GAST|nr:LOW QUALITY PROTEIN: hypothetical protein ElyMa_005692900 [Elysia marginata]